jgi:predicted GNAT family N-acyltransferase
MGDWTIRRLSQFKGDRRLFLSQDPPLDRFFHDLAGQYEKRNLGRTFIACSDQPETAIGYYTLSSSSVSFESVPDHLPRHPIPTFLIGRLAVDHRWRGQRLGEFLLFDALKRVARLAEETGAFAVEVDAYETAVPFYKRYGFTPFVGQPLRLFLPLKQILKLKL